MQNERAPRTPGTTTMSSKSEQPMPIGTGGVRSASWLLPPQAAPTDSTTAHVTEAAQARRPLGPMRSFAREETRLVGSAGIRDRMVLVRTPSSITRAERTSLEDCQQVHDLRR